MMEGQNLGEKWYCRRFSNAACLYGMLLCMGDAKHMQYKVVHGSMALPCRARLLPRDKEKKKWKRLKIGSRTQQRFLGLWL